MFVVSTHVQMQRTSEGSPEVRKSSTDTVCLAWVEAGAPSPWPEAEEVAPYVNDDPIFLNLYRELYYRHIYARVQGGPTVEQRLVLYLGAN